MTPKAVNQPSIYSKSSLVKDLYEKVKGFFYDKRDNQKIHVVGCREDEFPWCRRMPDDLSAHFFYVNYFLFTNLGIKFPFSSFTARLWATSTPPQSSCSPTPGCSCVASILYRRHMFDSLRTPFFNFYNVDRKSLLTPEWVSIKARPGSRRFTIFKATP